MGERSYNGVTRADMNRIRSGLGGYGISIPDGDNVEVSGPLGVKMSVQYDEASKILTLGIIDKPAFVPESQIWRVIESTATKKMSG